MSATHEAITAEVLSELNACGSLAQIAGWLARWSASLAPAQGALVWIADVELPDFRCAGAWGTGIEGNLRRSVPRDLPLLRNVSRARETLLILRSELEPAGWLAPLSPEVAAAVTMPLRKGDEVVAVLALLFGEVPEARNVARRLEELLRQATVALVRAHDSEKRRVGTFHAVERLTSLYDLSKAFVSTLDLSELYEIIARKAALFAEAEVATLWLLDASGNDVIHASTAVSERFQIEAPDAVGSSIVGDILASGVASIDNAVDPESALATESEYLIQSVLAVPLFEQERCLGALVIANKRGRRRQFSEDEKELMNDLARQAARALHNARQYEAEKKVEELDALLAVSREITSTLDLDKVLKTIVNATSALISYDRCGIAVMQRGTLQLNAVSGLTEIDRKEPSIARLDELLQWVYFSGSDIGVLQDEEGEIVTDRPETEEKFSSYFKASGMRSFYGVLLHDAEGKLGVLGFESSEPLVFDPDVRDLLQILVNQATVSVRNAQLYQQVPLAGIWKPLREKTRRFTEIRHERLLRWLAGAAAVTLISFLIPWWPRVVGPARIVPGKRISLTVPVDGIVQSVTHREGDLVAAGEVIGTIRDEAQLATLAGARSELQMARGEVARNRVAGDGAALFQSMERMRQLESRITLNEAQLGRLTLRAPASGIILTPRLEERVGRYLENGSEFAALAEMGSVRVEISVPERDVALIHLGDRAAIKVHPHPSRTFHAVISRIGAQLEGSEDQRFVTAECVVSNGDQLLRAGMLGTGKVTTQRVSLARAVLRAPARWVWTRLWPLLP